jgi:hypothetical protein
MSVKLEKNTYPALVQKCVTVQQKGDKYMSTLVRYLVIEDRGLLVYHSKLEETRKHVFRGGRGPLPPHFGRIIFNLPETGAGI